MTRPRTNKPNIASVSRDAAAQDQALAAAQSWVEAITGAWNTPMRWRLIDQRHGVPVIARRNARQFFGSLADDDFCDKLCRANDDGFDAYVVAQGTADTLPADAAVSSKDIVEGRVIFAEWDDVEPVESFHIAPTATITRGPRNRWAIWRVQDLAPSKITDLQKRLAQYYGSDATVCDRARIIRVPGFTSWKRETPQRYTFHKGSGHSERTSDHAALLPQLQRAAIKEGDGGDDYISEKRLRYALSFIDPSFDKEPSPRNAWLAILGAIGDAKIGRADMTYMDFADKFDLADAFSSGELGDFDTPTNYRDIDDVIATMEHLSREGIRSRASIGSVIHAAEAAGMDKTKHHRLRGAEIFTNPERSASRANAMPDTDPSPRNEDALVKPDGLYDGPELSDRPRPREIVPGVLVEASYSVASGRSQSGKSFNELALALSVATGKPWLGFEPTATGTVLYVAAEGQSRIQKDIQAWCTEFGVDPENLRGRFFVFDRSARLNTETGQEVFDQILAWIEHVTGRLPFYAVFDTLRRNMAGGVSQEEPTSEVLNRVNDLQTRGIAITLIAHHGRSHEETKGLTEWQDDADQVRIYSGTVAKRDTEITFSKVKTGEDGWRVAITYVERELDDGTQTLVAAKGERIEGKRPKGKAAASDDETNKSILDAAVVRVLSQNHLRDWSTRKLAEAIAMDEAIEISSDALRKRYLKALREDKSTQSSACYDVHQDRWRLPALTTKRPALRVIDTAKGTDEPVDWEDWAGPPDDREVPLPHQDYRKLFKPIVHSGGRA